MGKIIEGVWDCTYCNTDKIRGSIRKCPTCGRQRDDGVKFYIADPKNYISDEAAANLNKNPDWLCSFCDGLNSDDNTTCYNCGASREDSELNYFQNREKKEREKAEREQAEIHVSNANDIPKPQKPNKNWKKRLKVGLALFIVLAIIAGIVYACLPKKQEVVVESFEWERVLEVEEYKTVQESDWKVPSGGRVYDQREEIKEYKQVFDHYETKTRTYTEQVLDHYETVVVGHRDLGNGHFEEITERQPVYRTETKTETYQEPFYRQEPVYATKYYYDIERWVHKKDYKTSEKNHEPYWYDYKCAENERTQEKSATYNVVVKTEKGKTKKCELSYSEWAALKEGQTVTMKISMNGEAEIIK